MHVIRGRNVHTLLPLGLSYLDSCGIPMPSRAGDVIVAPGPVTSVYDHPTERVLFWPERDANPFFHFFEALWMLAGRDDLAFLTQFVKRFADYSDDGRTLAGAYGFRWREHWQFDQIERAVALIKANPNTRRAVICMWDPEADLREDESRRDIPCNTQVMLSTSYGRRDEPNALNLTVTCRSNDAVWGAYGANAVHFSFLQEYLAARLSLEVGILYQVSNNFHAYADVYHKVYRGDLLPPHKPDPYSLGDVQPFPLIKDAEAWDREFLAFLEVPAGHFTEPFFESVAKPMWWAHAAYKRNAYVNALEIIETCLASDWRRAGREWLERRRDNWQAKQRAIT